ncbi:3-phosphoshikimate 1-carboxyvinyltransferase [Aliiglaciecola sp. 2_MG-2023]|uniref:3-phosphoshikimate 1-carboxyvinyltransferase n=1 Tax=unclassified Aliiglaciecola TaxID=2593648 RepID=UPI0026E26E81|nr:MULTISPECIES: 3-phosphoshikimate 1-carboxyvinyltransferase [unclassified Aliiglaciecola]MDO6712194.1 3-phosphoshikimate 1-carboxyvinyltransferase [Aliiglaciecola sp. 2_MG-2023]MDO6753568.1 3-phosphoshikimate 1-carboxyvinyltransferase [Aliiglaciecola sp. 1_MG-2023]
MNRKISIPIEQDPAIINLLSRMPKEVQASFTEIQLSHLRNAVACRQWGKHRIDFRTTFGLFRRRYYAVFLFGHNLRSLTREQQKRQLFLNSLLLTCLLIFSCLLGLLTLYLIKSALGINLFENFSLGIWSWFAG